jgi:UDP-3-O-acyl-N-acetylglucosamine deacetylase
LSSHVYRRRTLAREVDVSGVGLHGGEPTLMRLRPGSKGIGFHRGGTRFAAVAENVTDTTRSTRLGEVNTVEHLMSALAGLEITDLEIEVEGDEAPGLDGSAAPWVSALVEAGLEDLGEATAFPPFKRVFFQEGELSVGAASGAGHWRYDYVLNERWPGTQSFEAQDVVAQYGSEIAPARTFALAEEIPMILQLGLARGLDENSALILGIEGYKNEARFDDEPARHKLLDLCGDLYLSGLPLRCLNVVAVRSGHRSNVKVAALLREASRDQAQRQA